MAEPANEPEHPAAVPPPGPASKLGIVVIAGALIVDQVSKWAATAFLELNQPVDVLPFLALNRTTNTGVAFSFLRGVDSTIVLLAVSAITILVLVFWARAREGGALAAVGYGLIVGGAVGNIVDRVVNGYVVDFLLFHLGDQLLFVSNLADLALTLGPIVLIAAYLGISFRRKPRG